MLGKNSDKFIRETYQALYVPIPIQRQHALIDKHARGIVRTNKIRELDEQKNTIVHDYAANMSQKGGVARISEVTRNEYDMLRSVNASDSKFGIIAPPVLRRSVPVERLGRTELKEMATAESRLQPLSDRVAEGLSESAVLTTDVDFADVEERLMRKGKVEEHVDAALIAATRQIVDVKDPLAKSRRLVRAALKVPARMPLIKPSFGGAAHAVGNVGRSAQQRSGLQPEAIGPNPLPPSVAPPSAPYPQQMPPTGMTPPITPELPAPYVEPSTPVKIETPETPKGKAPVQTPETPKPKLKPKKLFDDAGAGSSTDPTPSPGLPQTPATPVDANIPAENLPFLFPKMSDSDFGGSTTQQPVNTNFVNWQNDAASPYLNPNVGLGDDTPFSFGKSRPKTSRAYYKEDAHGVGARERSTESLRDTSLFEGRSKFKTKTYNTRSARIFKGLVDADY